MANFSFAQNCNDVSTVSYVMIELFFVYYDKISMENCRGR